MLLYFRPENFSFTLEVLSALCFDLSQFSDLFCLWKVGYFTAVQLSIAALAFILVALAVTAKWEASLRPACTEAAVYLMLFTYPVFGEWHCCNC